MNQKGQPSSQPILSDMTTEELQFISSLMQSQVFEAGQVICKEGDPADKLFFVEEGQVSVWVNVLVSVSKKKKKRINVIGEGFAFGEGALLGAESRIADIVADQKSIVSWFDTHQLFDNNSSIALNIQKKLYKNLAIETFHKLEWTNKEIKSLMQ
jgi:CRP-like cAMP-binding protein